MARVTPSGTSGIRCAGHGARPGGPSRNSGSGSATTLVRYPASRTASARPRNCSPRCATGRSPIATGWFSEFYAESRTWIATPPWFRSWVVHEQHAATLRIWQLGVLSGLLQTEEYARAILTVEPGVTDDDVSARLTARLARQAILARDDPPAARFLVDEAALRRRIGSPGVMAAQLAHLGGVARLPNVTIQAVPNIAHARPARRFRGRRARLVRRDRGCRPGVRGR